jgi:hypothetical protein
MDVCPRLSVLWCPVWVEALQRADYSSKESYHMSNISRNLLYVRRPRSFKDCRATGKKGELVALHVGVEQSHTLMTRIAVTTMVMMMMVIIIIIIIIILLTTT